MMPIKDILLALCVVIIWGINFAIIKLGLHGMPPLLLAGCRFILVFFPACLFIKPPQIPLRLLIIYGVTISFGQFAFLFCAINVGMPTGVASLVIQSQVFFSIILGIFFFSEKLKKHQYIGISIAVIGMLLLIESGMASSSASLPLLGIILTLFAGFSWALGNICNKKIMQLPQPPQMFSLLVWGAIPPAILFLLSSLILEDHELILHSLIYPQTGTIIALVYLVVMATMLGFGIWGKLLAKYPTNYVTPFALLVPVIGLSTGYLIYGESLSVTQLIGAIAIMLGLITNVFGEKMMQRLRASH